jgi:hypothetical protein
MSMGPAEYRYSDWTHEALARAMVQAEGDILELREQLQGVEEERDRFYRESRDSATILGRILLDLGHNACWPKSDPDISPGFRRLRDRPPRPVYGDGIRTELDAEREARSSWSPPEFPGGGR